MGKIKRIKDYIVQHEAYHNDGYSLSLLADDIENDLGIDSESDLLWNVLDAMFPERQFK